MAPKRGVKVNNFEKKLSVDDVLCPLCRTVFVKPVTFPCSHSICISCFESNVQDANLVCPICGVRIGSWVRSATKSNKLINETFWKEIQDLHPSLVKSRLNKSSHNKVFEKNKPKDEHIFEKNNTSNEVTHNLNKQLKKNGLESGFVKTKEHSDKVAKQIPFSRLTEAKVVCDNLDNQTETQKLSSDFLNSYATKRYTCKILCQNAHTRDPQRKILTKSIIAEKNKQIKKVTGSDLLLPRSNSIESECLYFKPIDHHFKAPSENLSPIKVPTKRPNINTKIKILAPCGKHQLLNSLESAFARLFPAGLLQKSSPTTEILQNEPAEVYFDNIATRIKRKRRKSGSNAQKKVKANSTTELKSNTDIEQTEQCGNHSIKSVSQSDTTLNSFTEVTSVVKISDSLGVKEKRKLALQEKADFEFAKKLQEEYNRSAKYLTRSTVPKQSTGRQQTVQIGKVMKVK